MPRQTFTVSIPRGVDGTVDTIGIDYTVERLILSRGLIQRAMLRREWSSLRDKPLGAVLAEFLVYQEWAQSGHIVLSVEYAKARLILFMCALLLKGMSSADVNQLTRTR